MINNKSLVGYLISLRKCHCHSTYTNTLDIFSLRLLLSACWLIKVGDLFGALYSYLYEEYSLRQLPFLNLYFFFLNTPCSLWFLSIVNIAQWCYLNFSSVWSLVYHMTLQYLELGPELFVHGGLCPWFHVFHPKGYVNKLVISEKPHENSFEFQWVLMHR